MNFHQWDQVEISPLILELRKEGTRKNVKLQHRRAPSIVDSLPPVVLPIIKELAGDLFGDLSTLPPSLRPGPRS